MSRKGTSSTGTPCLVKQPAFSQFQGASVVVVAGLYYIFIYTQVALVIVARIAPIASAR